MTNDKINPNDQIRKKREEITLGIVRHSDVDISFIRHKPFVILFAGGVSDNRRCLGAFEWRTASPVGSGDYTAI
jgi:hypothetical protein